MLSKREWWGLQPLEGTVLGWVLCFQMEPVNKATLGFVCGWPGYIMASFPGGTSYLVWI